MGNFAHRPKNFIDLSVVKYPGIDKSVMEQITQAFKRDYSEAQKAMGIKPGDLEMKDEGATSPETRQRNLNNLSFGLSNIKLEDGADEGAGSGENFDFSKHDIRNFQPA